MAQIVFDHPRVNHSLAISIFQIGKQYLAPVGNNGSSLLGFFEISCTKADSFPQTIRYCFQIAKISPTIVHYFSVPQCVSMSDFLYLRLSPYSWRCLSSLCKPLLLTILIRELYLACIAYSIKTAYLYFTRDDMVVMGFLIINNRYVTIS